MLPTLRLDPRIYQIACLASLFLYGITVLGFDITPTEALVTLVTVLITQWICTRLWRLPHFDPRSALISGLSLCLLLRTNSLKWIVLGAVITIASKFILRLDGKHIFNPTNLGLVAMMLLTTEIWVSPAQWGTTTFLAFLFSCAGGLVVNRAARGDVTYAFIFFYLALLFGRSLWLGEPVSIPLHRLQSGALLLFTFFMISDPKTTPDSRAGRILFAFLVAFGGWYIQFRLFRTNGLIWSLAGFSILVPLIDRFLPGKKYQWSQPDTGRANTTSLLQPMTASIAVPHL